MAENFFDNSGRRARVKDHYEILGVSRTATPEEIKSALRKKAQELHPDKPENRMKEEEFKDVNAAYQVLSNPEKRRSYDLTLQRSRPVVTAPSRENVTRPGEQGKTYQAKKSHTRNYQTNDFNDDWIRNLEEKNRETYNRMMDEMDRKNREFQKSMDEARAREQKWLDDLHRQSEEQARRMMDNIEERNRKFQESVDEKMRKRARQNPSLDKQKKQPSAATKNTGNTQIQRGFGARIKEIIFNLIKS